jgi:hypothetical protein
VPDGGHYALKFSLQAGDGSQTVHSLGERDIEIKPNVFASIRDALAFSWEIFRSMTTVQQLGLIAVVLLSLGLLIVAVVRRQRLRKYRKVQIFISYRRADSRMATRKLYRELQYYFHRDLLFRDREGIEWGSHFPKRIFECLRSSQVVLVVIGDEWSQIKDEEGRRRLEQEDDFVRQEVLYALKHKKYIIPILVDGAVMPNDLPAELADLALLDAMDLEVDSGQFQSQVKKLAIILRKQLGMPAVDED